ncbi:Zinc finger, RING-type [Gossypium australe]|uniref:RING-type E3 ubiquitin transferase n=1 Tax=Gossypium australe TaxID=47621 RepID=A0A5B6UGY6_9ROSI|nr:Zinc finger, RING-type [Gossypium australe]
MTPLNFFFVFLLSFFLHPFFTYGEFCPRVSCGNVSVDFPFRLTNQPDCCGDPNFNLLCTTTNQIIISFPFSGNFMVNTINYSNPYLQLTDPCITKRLLQGFNLSGTPFQPLYTRTYIFSNCSTDSNISVVYPSALFFSCLSSISFLVWGIAKNFYDPSTPVSSCLELAEISVPQHGPGLSSGTKYAVTFILGTPISLIAVCIIYYNVRVHCYDHRRHQPNVEISGLTSEPQLAGIIVNGLDGSSIEAYPITLLGENMKLPRPNDYTCSICLSEYQAKETIRTIPDCNHYFHASCIDEWLKLNAACPVCRRTPDHDSAHLITLEYPFRLTNQPDCCGHPDFNLSISCRSRYHLPDQTIINFPSSSDFGWYELFGLGYTQNLLQFVDTVEFMSRASRDFSPPSQSSQKMAMVNAPKRKKRYEISCDFRRGNNHLLDCVHCYDHRHHPNAEISSLTEEQQLADITVNGLDGSRIEAYPITLLGENFELPRPNDNRCSICLSEYQAKEIIRTIPDCNHYFHANCIDEWFKLNAACSVCRNTPDHDSARLITRSTSSFSSRPPV